LYRTKALACKSRELPQIEGFTDVTVQDRQHSAAGATKQSIG